MSVKREPRSELRLPFSRIALRIYIVGLVQVFIAMTGVAVIVLSAHRLHPETAEESIPGFVAEQVLQDLSTPPTFESRAALLANNLHAGVRVVDAAGTTIFAQASSLESCWPEPPAERSEKITPDRVCASRRATLADGRVVRVDVVRRRAGLSLEQFAGIHLLVFGVGSLLLGRSLTGPLRKMMKAARAFGRGDMSARIGSRRRDELGDVARAFDEMADHVVDVRRAERELLANISHELRTPLTRIRLALEFAADEKPEVAFQSRKDIAEDLDELEVLIRDILTAARLEIGDPTEAKGIPPLRKEKVEVAEIIDRAEARFRAAHPDRELVVSADRNGTTRAVIDVDPVQLRRAIDNLLDNAHKYTREPDKAIELRVEASSSAVAIRVTDRGVGISQDDQKRLFRPFFRVDRSRSRATGGLGLGLLLVRRIAEAHGGSVALESDPGRGTEAILELPLATVPG